MREASPQLVQPDAMMFCELTGIDIVRPTRSVCCPLRRDMIERLH